MYIRSIEVVAPHVFQLVNSHFTLHTTLAILWGSWFCYAFARGSTFDIFWPRSHQNPSTPRGYNGSKMIPKVGRIANLVHLSRQTLSPITAYSST